MKVYMVITKTFYTSDGIDHQVSDALQPVPTYSSYKKAKKALKYYEQYYKNLGYKRKDEYNNLFPVEHFTMENKNFRVVLYILESEVE